VAKGTSLGSDLAEGTSLASLGIDAGAIRIETDDGVYDIDLSGAATLGDVLNLIESSGAGVSARISEDRTGIEIVANSPGSSFRVSDRRILFGETVGSIDRDTPLFNVGITPPGLTSVEIQQEGETVTVDLSSAATVGDIIDLMNGSGAGVTVSINPAGDGLTIVSNITGKAMGPLVVAESGGGTSAARLGILGVAAGDTASALGIATTSVNTEEENVSLFQTLIDLRESLLAEHPGNGLTDSIARLDEALDHNLEQVATIGARLNRVEMARSRAEQNELFLTELISENEDVDLAEVLTQITLQETALQGSLNVAARMLQMSLLDFLG
jgi:flagellin-like hook-associated protein FlgL